MTENDTCFELLFEAIYEAMTLIKNENSGVQDAA